MEHRTSKFVRVVPAVRTIPGVETFDYKLSAGLNLEPGDVIRVPFRNKPVAAVVQSLIEESPFADKAVTLERSEPLLRLGPAFIDLLHASAERTGTSLPSVFKAWVRTVPLRAKPSDIASPSQPKIPIRQTRYAPDRYAGQNGLIAEAQNAGGRVLILTPWIHRATALSDRLKANVLHSQTTPTASWKAIREFTDAGTSFLVTTRVGAWLSSVADTVLIDEPENDDFKSDESSPRLDARWVVDRMAAIRPNLSIISFSVTPRLESLDQAPVIEANLSVEAWTKRRGSSVDCVSPESVRLIEQAVESGRGAIIIHSVQGERSKIACSDCGWTATCTACAFPLAMAEGRALCRRCGRKFEPPNSCVTCGGMDFSRGVPGIEQLQAQCARQWRNAVRVMDAGAFDSRDGSGEILVITDLGRIAGGVEDIRRRERLVIAWRRIAADAARSSMHVRVQGPEDLIAQCAAWLTRNGVEGAWNKERDERKTFGYPPAVRLAKLLCTSDAQSLQTLHDDLSAAIPSPWTLRGPYPVAYRSITRIPRFVMHAIAPSDVTEAELLAVLSPFRKRAIIDLDPVAFFM